MVNYKLIITGTLLYLTGFIGSLLLAFIIPTILDAGHTIASTSNPTTITNSDGNLVTIDTAYDDTTIQGISWLGVIIIWLLTTIVVPLAVTTEGLMQESENDTTHAPTMLSVIGGVLWSLLTIILFYILHAKMNLIVSLANTITLAQTATGESYILLTIIYWMMISIAVLTNAIIVPTYIIAKYRGQ